MTCQVFDSTPKDLSTLEHPKIARRRAEREGETESMTLGDARHQKPGRPGRAATEAGDVCPRDGCDEAAVVTNPFGCAFAKVAHRLSRFPNSFTFLARVLARVAIDRSLGSKQDLGDLNG